MTTPVTSKPERRRHHAADTAKGIAILFVVFGHAWRGVYGAGVLQNEQLFLTVDRLIYAWHMPLFFFLSGLHFLSHAQRQSPAPFFKARVIRLLWPLTLWTWIFFAFRFAAGAAANAPVSLSEFPIIPVPPYEHLWFLWALFLIQSIVFGFIYWGRPPGGMDGLRLRFAGLTVVLTALFSVYYFAVEPFDLAVVHLPYFLAGVALAGLSEKRPPLWGAAGAAVGIIVLLCCVMAGWPAVPVSLGLVLLLWVLFAYLDREDPTPGPIISLLRYLGTTSMAIYLAHTIFSAAFRIGLVKVGVTSVSLHLLVAVAVGVIGPLVLLWIANRLKMSKLLGL